MQMAGGGLGLTGSVLLLVPGAQPVGVVLALGGFGLQMLARPGKPTLAEAAK